MTTSTHRSLAVASALVAVVGLTACSGDDESTQRPARTATPPAAAIADPDLDGLVGPGCAAYDAQEQTGTGSFAAMAEDPLTVAISHNPLLTTLNTALSGKLNKKVKLRDTLNGGDYTVFAPVDVAFSQVAPATLAKLETDRPLLTKILTYHLVQGRLAPNDVIGKKKTVEGRDLKVTGNGNTLKVNDARVICGGIRTANATLYLIDTVLTVPK